MSAGRWILRHPFAASPVIALGVCLAVAGLVRMGFLEPLELQGYDLLVRKRGFPPPHPDLVFVDFDDATLDALGVFPVPRAAMAEVLEKVAAGGPELIGLDMLLSEKRPNEAEGEKRLVEVLGNAGNVILISNFATLQLAPSEPLPEFRDQALDVAFGNLIVDADGFIRRMYLGVRTADYKAVSFPVALATNYLQKPLEPARPGTFRLGSVEVPVDDSGFAASLVGYWSPHPAAVLPARRVLDPAFQPGTLKGKVVVVGQSSSKGKDLFATPIFRAGVAGESLMSGPEIHLAAIATLLTGRTMSIQPPRVLWLANLVLAFAVIALVIALRPSYAVVGVAAVLAGTYLAAQHLFSSSQVWMRFVSTEAVILLALPTGLAFRFLQERQLKAEAEAERGELMGLFGRYVSPDVAAEIWRRKAEIVLAGEEKTATVVFTDIRNFTGLTANKPSAEVLAWLNDYFTAMSGVIDRHKGFINKFIGDGMMIVFGVPLEGDPREDACRAVRAGLEMLERVEAFNVEQAGTGRPHIGIGVGVHTGPLTAGNVGSRDRLEYSVIGETVNLASRLESLCKEFKSSLILSPTTEELVRGDFPTEPLGETQVRGFEGKIKIYTVRPAPPTN
jgi:class 3 adenylate cyclase/CHASE2 domain-containing sensor protein